MVSEPRPAGVPDSVQAAAWALPSRRHAEMLFDAVRSRLGAAGWHETAGGGRIRRLFRRDRTDPSQLVPWPLLELNVGSRFGVVTDWIPVGNAPHMPHEPPPKPAPPKLRGLGPGEIRLVDGPEHIEIVYSDEGQKHETCRSSQPHPLVGLAPALAGGSANPVELLARFLASQDPGRHGPGRVRLPAAMPHGAAGVWRCGLSGLRRALFEGVAPEGAQWAVADGLTGTALAFGATREEALERWREVVAARPPWPEPRPRQEPPPPPPEPNEGPGQTFVIHAPKPDVELPERLPENVPAALVPLAPAPAEPPSFGSWVRLLGAYGATSFAAWRREGKGFTLVGEHVLGLVDLDRLDAEIGREEELHEERLAMAQGVPGGRKRWPCRTACYRVEGPNRLAVASSSGGGGWNAGNLDGDLASRQVVRQRWVQ